MLAFAITRRSRELAVRMAVGATSGDVVRLVTAHTVRLVGIGATLGIALTFGLSRVVRAAGGAGSIFDPALHVFVWPVLAVIVIGAHCDVGAVTPRLQDQSGGAAAQHLIGGRDRFNHDRRHRGPDAQDSGLPESRVEDRVIGIGAIR